MSPRGRPVCCRWPTHYTCPWPGCQTQRSEFIVSNAHLLVLLWSFFPFDILLFLPLMKMFVLCHCTLKWCNLVFCFYRDSQLRVCFEYQRDSKLWTLSCWDCQNINSWCWILFIFLYEMPWASRGWSRMLNFGSKMLLGPCSYFNTLSPDQKCLLWGVIETS